MHSLPIKIIFFNLTAVSFSVSGCMSVKSGILMSGFYFIYAISGILYSPILIAHKRFFFSSLLQVKSRLIQTVALSTRELRESQDMRVSLACQ